MAAKCRVPNCGGETRQNLPQPKVFNIPYFEHQQLDPSRFPLGKPASHLTLVLWTTDRSLTGVGAPLAESPAVENRKRVIADTVANDDKDEEDTGIKYPGSDEDRQVCCEIFMAALVGCCKD